MRAVVLLLCLAVLAACSKPQVFNATDLTGADFGKDFKLTDHKAQTRQLSDFKGKVVVLFFGYTQCPDVCPTNMTTLASVMQQLGPEAERVQVLFVTVDPERDTQALLAQYVPAFHPGFLGLTGNAEDTALVAKTFKIFYQKQPGKTAGSYTVDHSTGTYVFDPKGHLRLYVKHGADAGSIAQDIRALLAGR